MNFTGEFEFLTTLPPWAQALSGLALLVAAATLANAVVKQVILRLLERGLDTAALAVTSGQLAPIVRRLSHILPAIVLWRVIHLVPPLPSGVIYVTQNLVLAFIALTILLAIRAGLNLVKNLFQLSVRHTTLLTSIH